LLVRRQCYNTHSPFFMAGKQWQKGQALGTRRKCECEYKWWAGRLLRHKTSPASTEAHICLSFHNCDCKHDTMCMTMDQHSQLTRRRIAITDVFIPCSFKRWLIESRLLIPLSLSCFS
jgi:hypothetical protein